MKRSALFWSMIASLTLFWSMTANALEFPDFTRLVEKHSAAVVSINTTSTQNQLKHPPIPEDSPFFEPFKRFFEQLPETPQRRPPASVGSGFIISADGYVLTNAHVVQDAEEITVGLSDRREISAKVIGTDPRSDIALLKIDGDALPTVKLGDSTKLKVGQWVLAIGSPFGFERTATQGIISALGRSLPRENYVPFIQTDAAVNPGNSGGPLFNLEGEVIGINAQIYSRSGGYQGVSFAIPMDVVMDVVAQLKTNGKVSRGWLGVLIQEVTPELAQSFGLERPSGALVGQVMQDSPAQKAGVQAGDIIIAYNDQPVTRSGALPPLVGRTRPGNEASMTVIRNGREQELSVTIEELPEDPQRVATVAPPDTGNRLGLTVKDLSPEQRKNFTGVAVADVDNGPASRAGIRPGDIILSINQQNIESVTGFQSVIEDLPSAQPLPVLVQRGNGRLFLALTIPAEE